MKKTALTLAALLALTTTLVAEEEKKPASPPKKSERPAKEGKVAEKAPEKPKDVLSPDTFSGLELRNIGPAITSGRIVDFAVLNGGDTVYVATASGGVWKTTTHGTSWKPIFDGEGSYSIGCVTLDPKDPLTVWVGTGENNSQRSVSYGDGVYVSHDGGKSWENAGLKNSEHIGRIVIDPRDSKRVFVAAQGPLWNDGGDRGLYLTKDGGKTWKRVLHVSEHTGVNEVWIDPRNPDVMYASSYQRRRHVFTLIDGGPESAIYKSVDGGETWKKCEKGIPKADKGKIGLAVSPANPDVVYAVIEASGDKDKGFYRSTDSGGSWERMGDQTSTSPQYYNELIPDPVNKDRVYAMDTFMKVTEDGGKTWKNAGEKYKHVDNHALWIDPENTDHLLNGNDGGIYESWDRAQSWAFKANLPVTQFYRVAVGNDGPGYTVCGGTQDNFSLCGPARTLSNQGIRNSDWFVATGGDGFQPRVDPEDANTIYAESQHGGLVRFDRRTGERVGIQPQPGAGDPPLRWNWDSPLIISPFSHSRLYFAAQRVFRSDDRGDTWKPISGDLTAQIDRNKLPVMGRIWSVDAVAKNASTSFYGNIVSLCESPKKDGLLWVGTDDGLIQLTEDGGGAWKKHAKFPGVPDQTYVSYLFPSWFDQNVVFAAFDNHQRGDFAPYLLRSDDRGATWVSIAGDLPKRGTVYTVVQDFEKPDLLFAGTEFGLFFTLDGGKKWIQMKGGMPPIAVRDLAIQRKSNDLVLATFGRGFYVLDDYSSLRRVTREGLEKGVDLFPVKSAEYYVPAEPLGLKDKSFQGEAFYVASNPPYGAVVTYFLKDEIKSRKAARQEEEKRTVERGHEISYPSWEALKSEAREEEPSIVVTVKDEQGNVVRRISGPVKAGFHRVAWDLRYPAADPTELKPRGADNPFFEAPIGPLVVPGTYRVSLAKRVDGVETALGEAQSFTVQPIGTGGLPNERRAELLAFQRKTASLQRAVLGSEKLVKETLDRVAVLKKALVDTTGADAKLYGEASALEARLKDIQEELSGGTVVARYNEPEPPSISDRVSSIVSGHWATTGMPTATHRQAYDLAAKDFAGVLQRLTQLVEVDLKKLEDRAEQLGAPWTPGRVPRWSAQ
jgi:photosystem II stability/assembly factor-like uncharacterized protein